MRSNSQKGSIIIAALVGLTLLISGAAYEFHKATEKNTAKAIVTTVANVDTAKKAADDLAAKNAKDDAARVALEQAHQEQTQIAAGYVAAIGIALNSDPSPSLSSKIASLMDDSAAEVVGPPTSAQVVQFTRIIKALAAENADLAAANTNLKNVTLKTTAELEQANKKNDQVTSTLATARQTSQEAEAAKDEAVKATGVAVHDAAVSAEQIKLVQISWEDRAKAWILGLGLSGLALFIAIPLVSLAFPELAPYLRVITSPLLKLWHLLAAKEQAAVAALHTAAVNEVAVVNAKLAAEVAAHNATKATLVAVATAP